MTDNHSFNKGFATKFGIEEAIIFDHIYFWCLANASKDINKYQLKTENKPRYWTFDTCAKLADKFSYMTPSKIRRVLLSLEELGLIISGNFNKMQYDRTKWYAVTEKGEKEYTECCKSVDKKLYKNEDSNCQKCKMESEEMTNGNEQNEETIPHTYTNTNTDTNSIPLSAQSSSEADSNSKSSSVNQSANSISLAEREELRKKDEEIKELRKIVESLKADKESKPVKKTKTRKTKTDEELQTLFSEFSETDIQTTTNCINNFIAVKQRNDPRFMRSRNQLDNWSYELLLFSKTQNRDLNEVSTVWNWAINDYFWSGTINSVSAFTKKYETLIQKCNSRQNRGYQSRPKYNAIDFDNQNYNEIF